MRLQPLFLESPPKPMETRQIHFLTKITYCNINIAILDMTLGEKIRYLREVKARCAAWTVP